MHQNISLEQAAWYLSKKMRGSPKKERLEPLASANQLAKVSFHMLMVYVKDTGGYLAAYSSSSYGWVQPGKAAMQ